MVEIPTFKSKSVDKFFEIRKTLDLCDIWRVKNRDNKSFNFRRKHLSGLIQRRLGCICISNSLQESVVRTEIKIFLVTTHRRSLK